MRSKLNKGILEVVGGIIALTLTSSALSQTLDYQITVALGGDEFDSRVVRESLPLAIPWQDVSEEIFPGRSVPVKIVLRRGETEELVYEDARDLPYNPNRTKVILKSRKLDRFNRFKPTVVVTIGEHGSEELGKGDSRRLQTLEQERRVEELITSSLKKIGMRFIDTEMSQKQVDELLRDPGSHWSGHYIWVRGELKEREP